MVPDSIDGPFYNIWLVILLEIVTCGIWGIFWTYRTNEDLKKRGDLELENGRKAMAAAAYDDARLHFHAAQALFRAGGGS